MTSENDVLIINKQALMQAALELERQESLQSCMLLHCLDQLEDIYRKLRVILNNDQASIARTTFLSVLMKDTDWSALITDQQLDQWDIEARQALEHLP